MQDERSFKLHAHTLKGLGVIKMLQDYKKDNQLERRCFYVYNNDY